MIMMDKKYMYASCEPARVLCVDAPGRWPVVSITASGMVVFHSSDGKGVPSGSYNLIEVSPWDDFKDGDPVMVRMFNGGEWHRRYFAFSKDGEAWCYGDGKTKWTAHRETSPWPRCRRPTKEEMGE